MIRWKFPSIVSSLSALPAGAMGGNSSLGDGDAAVFVLGMVAGAAFAHNFGPAGSPKGIGPYAIPAVVIGFLVCLFIGFTMRERTQ